MTVAPRRAHDGERQLSANTSDVPTDEMTQPALPPTLFKLPHLNRPVAQPQANVATVVEPVSEIVEAAPSTVEIGLQEDPIVAPGNAPSASESVLKDDLVSRAPVVTAEPHETITKAQSTTAAAEPPQRRTSKISPYAELDNAPAGRTWMERVSSHGLVLVMLLIVVAAALLTGRNSGDPPGFDDSVAVDVGELQFDLGESTELPLPTHQHMALDLDAENAASASIDAPLETEAPVATDSASGDTAEFSVDGVAAETVGTAIGPLPVAEKALSEITAAVAPPAVTADAVTPPRSGNDPMAEYAPRIEVNKYVQGTDPDDLSGARQKSLAVPTLEELESAIAKEPQSHPGPEFSKTPFGITDANLLQRLNDLIEEKSGRKASAPTDPVYPTSNN